MGKDMALKPDFTNTCKVKVRGTKPLLLIKQCRRIEKASKPLKAIEQFGGKEEKARNHLPSLGKKNKNPTAFHKQFQLNYLESISEPQLYFHIY